MGVCLIVGAGAVAADLHLPLGQDDLLIAADGGWLTVERMGLTPHLVIGDFDSLGRRPDHPNTVVLPTVVPEEEENPFDPFDEDYINGLVDLEGNPIDPTEPEYSEETDEE